MLLYLQGLANALPSSSNLVGLLSSRGQQTRMLAAPLLSFLGTRRYFGAPRSLTSLASTSMTRPERMLPATSRARHSRAGRLRPIVRNLVVLRGGMTSKERRDSADQLASIATTAERVGIATGRYIREGSTTRDSMWPRRRPMASNRSGDL